ncbi:polysaccharide biosynthesis protein CapD [Emticicia oligotrophica DSM 17448]|uniref:Polysaccharide biosynthesis protein CapD n=1 Tax=Emticicia oligotrophica (strain DSM 17448 / CIP 109782 / MTCC 6937 / GPTSA100-15) TaxID=929562 RepID=A0ABM5N151_EMTOG|nr:nucleoside-diphosphate sugar epimerase/dehydratase [Emticicia oligotrophica]AFK03212.1 polysaccharide biosynthesis protein CapD [Emticicia oligotrophica DSM 17448]
MVKQVLHKYANQFASKQLILFIDCVICLVAFSIAVFLRFNLEFVYISPVIYKYHLFLVVIVRILSFYLFKSYQGIIRHSSSEDATLLFKAISLGTGILTGLSLISRNDDKLIYFEIPVSILAIDYFICLFMLISSRFVVKITYENLLHGFVREKPVIIYGSGELGLLVKNTLQSDKKFKYQILCFIDDNKSKVHKMIQGIRVLNKEETLKRYFTDGLVFPEVILAIQNLSIQQRLSITEDFLDMGVIIKSVPTANKWLNGELNIRQIQNVKIEDLLEREPIKINNKFVSQFLTNKKILVTGAAGSIGSEIVRQLLNHNPKELLLLDHAESALYDLETELFRLKKKSVEGYLSQIKTEVVDITDEKALRSVVKDFMPQVVFHAAAYKHVPLMEKNPYNAVKVNVFGTRNIANLSTELGVEKFVFISTDKAVNPTNVMGATKRLAEMYVHSLNAQHSNDTRFIITRFGNVLGSNGSVIPVFKKQIEAGGPITVTDKNVIRYFMTIPEACQLVLEAGTMGKGGEIFVFDMGEPVKIIDLAKKMIQLSGLEINKDIEIQFTGLRPGEKLYEELLNTNENTLPTYHPKIMIAKVISSNYEALNSNILHLQAILNTVDNNEIVVKLKEIVPEFISNNSEYEKLDALKESA